MSIGFYSQKQVVLPHPDYPMGMLSIIEKALQVAWQILRDKPQGDFDIKVADEDRITRELYTCLMNTVLDGGRVAGFTSDIFHITRDAKFESFNGNHLDKMPDMCIRINVDRKVSLRSVDGLFVECKPVGRAHPVGSTYCDQGISRFVNGEYAWALNQALMVGYASPQYMMPSKLTKALEKRAKKLGLVGKVEACKDYTTQKYCQKPHVTKHEREFVIPMTGKKPDIITIMHIWMNRE